MTGKLEGLVIPVMEPLGYPHGWAGEVAKRIQDAVPADCGQLVLNSESISDVLTCGGLWQGKEVVTPSPDHVFWLRRKLIHNITMEYLEHAMVWGPQKGNMAIGSKRNLPTWPPAAAVVSEAMIEPKNTPWFQSKAWVTRGTVVRRRPPKRIAEMGKPLGSCRSGAMLGHWEAGALSGLIKKKLQQTIGMWPREVGSDEPQ